MDRIWTLLPWSSHPSYFSMSTCHARFRPSEIQDLGMKTAMLSLSEFGYRNACRRIRYIRKEFSEVAKRPESTYVLVDLSRREMKNEDLEVISEHFGVLPNS